MAKPQQAELRRSGFTAPLDPDSIGSELQAHDRPDASGGPGGPVPEDNLPGHHPDEEQDKPSGDDFVARAREVAGEGEQGAEKVAGKKAGAKKAGTKKAGTKKASAKKAGAKKAGTTKAGTKKASATKAGAEKAPSGAAAGAPRPAAAASPATPAPPTKTSAPTAAPAAPVSPPPPTPTPAPSAALAPRTTYGNVVGAVAEAPVRLAGALLRRLRDR